MFSLKRFNHKEVHVAKVDGKFIFHVKKVQSNNQGLHLHQNKSTFYKSVSKQAVNLCLTKMTHVKMISLKFPKPTETSCKTLGQ